MAVRDALYSFLINNFQQLEMAVMERFYAFKFIMLMIHLLLAVFAFEVKVDPSESKERNISVSIASFEGQTSSAYSSANNS